MQIRKLPRDESRHHSGILGDPAAYAWQTASFRCSLHQHLYSIFWVQSCKLLHIHIEDGCLCVSVCMLICAYFYMLLSDLNWKMSVQCYQIQEVNDVAQCLPVQNKKIAKFKPKGPFNQQYCFVQAYTFSFRGSK